MDSGYIAPGENLAQALEDDYDVRRPLTPEEVVGLMDQLLCHEVRDVHQRYRGNRFSDMIAGCMAQGTSSLADAFHVNLP
jgi:hypothetical protein